MNLETPAIADKPLSVKALALKIDKKSQSADFVDLSAEIDHPALALAIPLLSEDAQGRVLRHLSRNGLSKDIGRVQRWFDCGGAPDVAIEKNGATLLIKVCCQLRSEGDDALFWLALERCDAKKTDDFGRTPLICETHTNLSHERVQALLQKSAVNACSMDYAGDPSDEEHSGDDPMAGGTALHACFSGMPEFFVGWSEARAQDREKAFALLFEKGDIFAKDLDGASVLSAAFRWRKGEGRTMALEAKVREQSAEIAEAMVKEALLRALNAEANRIAGHKEQIGCDPMAKVEKHRATAAVEGIIARNGQEDHGFNAQVLKAMEGATIPAERLRAGVEVEEMRREIRAASRVGSVSQTDGVAIAPTPQKKRRL